jgi:ubiquinone/menaquinone biosynthesis C-methylase UbiE
MKREKLVKTYEDLVKEAYSKKAEAYKATDKRERWDYLFSKLTADHYLLSQIDIWGKVVLNIGCAPHPIDELLFARKCKRWVATDINPDVLTAARKIVEEELSTDVASKIKFVEADARKLPFKDEEFDVVVAFSTIEHIPDEGWRKALAEIARVTKKGGYVVVTIPNKLNIAYWIWSWWLQKKGKAEFGFEVCLTPWQLKRAMKAEGLIPLKFASNFLFSPQIWVKWLRIPFLSYFGFRAGYLAQKM